MLKKIISGGQSGVEMAALETAVRLNIPHEGWAFQRKRAKEGAWPEQYNLKTIKMPSYHDRLEKNIMDSDGTVILTHGQLIIGTKIIKYLTNQNNKPSLYIDLTECSINHAISSIRKWMASHEIETVYFTGSKPVDESNIYEEAARVIQGVCGVEREQKMLNGFQPESEDSPS